MLIYPIPLGRVGGSPGFALNGISNGFKSKSFDNASLVQNLLSKKTFALDEDNFEAILISFGLETCVTFPILYNQIFGNLFGYASVIFNGS